MGETGFFSARGPNEGLFRRKTSWISLFRLEVQLKTRRHASDPTNLLPICPSKTTKEKEEKSS